MSDWTNSQDSHQSEGSTLVSSISPESDHQKRSDIVHAIINNRSLDHLGSILGSGWDVNETLCIPEHYKSPECATWDAVDATGFDKLVHHHTLRTALGEAARQGWTEGLKMLLDAGAKCKTADASSHILALALQCPDPQPEIIDLLLKHGADPNDNDDESKHIPLLLAVRCAQAVSIAKLLLEHGADPKVIGRKESGHDECPLSAALGSEAHDINPLLKTLLHFGANVNSFPAGYTPLLYSLEVDPHIFHLEQLDLFFLYGCDITREDGMGDTVLEHVIMNKSHSNTIRWLIRHGTDVASVWLTEFIDYFYSTYQDLSSEEIFQFIDTPLVLLKANGKGSHGAQIHFSKMEEAISSWLQADTQEEGNIHRGIQDMWKQCNNVQFGVFPRMSESVLKHFPKYLTQQMDDLQEFSDESLQIYPEDNQKYQDTLQDVLDRIATILEFLSQPQSLQSYCRGCIRENLVSLQPSVVKTLPGPPRLKRYILCHEI